MGPGGGEDDSLPFWWSLAEGAVGLFIRVSFIRAPRDHSTFVNPISSGCCHAITYTSYSGKKRSSVSVITTILLGQKRDCIMAGL